MRGMEGNQYDKAYQEEMGRLLRQDAAKKAREDFKNLKRAQRELESEVKRAQRDAESEASRDFQWRHERLPEEIPSEMGAGGIAIFVIAVIILSLFAILASHS